MADLFLHLAFARRLRLVEGLHPLAAQSVARRPSLVALGAVLPHLPGNERKGLSLWRRLFLRGGEAARWQRQLAPGDMPRAKLVQGLLRSDDERGVGPLARLALGLGFLAEEILESQVAELNSAIPTAMKASVERAQARLWLQVAAPSDLAAEWRVLLELADVEQSRRTFEQVDVALMRAFGQRPGKDAIGSWVRGLCAELQPLVAQSALPPSLGMPDHEARAAHFDQTGFLERVQDAVQWFIVIANRVAGCFEDGDAAESALTTALMGAGDRLLPASTASAGDRGQWASWQQARRVASLERGRNPKPAFTIDPPGESLHRSAANTAILNLSQLSAGVEGDDLPPPTDLPHAPPLPAMTMEIQASQVEEALAAGHFASPGLTQEVSLAQIEAEVASLGERVGPAGGFSHDGFPAPNVTQEVRAVSYTHLDVYKRQPQTV